MTLIIGKGGLAQGLLQHWPDATLVGRPEFDFSTQQDCDRLVQLHPNPGLVINTLGCITDDVWQNLTVNLVAPAYLTTQYLDCQDCHVVNISSASAWWPSYPGLDPRRFSYNFAKESLSNWGRHINRITIDSPSKALVTTVEPGRFKTRMSGWTGQEVSAIVDSVVLAVERRLQQVSCIR